MEINFWQIFNVYVKFLMPTLKSFQLMLWQALGALNHNLHFIAPKTFFRIALPVPTGSWRIFFSSSPMMR